MDRMLNSRFAPPRAKWMATPAGPVAPAVPIGVPQAQSIAKPVFFAGLAVLFVVFGIISEVIFYMIHANTYLLYLLWPPALLGVAAAGGIGRTFRHPAAKYWLMFYLLMIVAAPLSSWRGQSFFRVYDYGMYAFPMLIIIGGMAVKWQEIRAIFYVLAGACLVDLVATHFFTSDSQGRLSLDASGTIGNPNDLAAHFALLLPFVLYVVMDRKRNAFVRYALLAPIAYGIWVILGTASRGGLLALGITFVFMMWRASMVQRVMVLIVTAVLVLALPVFLPGATKARLASLFGEEHKEANESEESRSYLFKTSVIYTLQHPIFGVGPDQFGNYEGKMAMQNGERGVWHATHCAFTQVSSECGIPAMIFFLMGIGSALRMVNRVWRQARMNGYKDIAAACFCYLTAMVAFLSCITFLADAYRFYLPSMIGLAIAMSMAATRFMQENPNLSTNPAQRQLVAS